MDIFYFLKKLNIRICFIVYVNFEFFGLIDFFVLDF